MLTSSCADKLQSLLDAVIYEGKWYGLELNWKKTVLMRVRNTGSLGDPSGNTLAVVEQAVYLGGLLNTGCTAKPEFTRRLGEARGVFKSLQQCWSHANISMARKVELYRAIVVPKLLYNLESVWALQADKDRLNSSHV